MKNAYRVIVRTSPKDAPYDFEISAALIVANYSKTDVVFLRPISLKSPDLKVKNYANPTVKSLYLYVKIRSRKVQYVMDAYDYLTIMSEWSIM